MPWKGRADIAQASDAVPVIHTTFSKLPLDRNNGCAEGQLQHLAPGSSHCCLHYPFRVALRDPLPLEFGPQDERQVSEENCM